MVCPNVIGRDGWDWVEFRKRQKKNSPPIKGGMIHFPMYVDRPCSGVIVVVECYCCFINIIADPPRPRLTVYKCTRLSNSRFTHYLQYFG